MSVSFPKKANACSESWERDTCSTHPSSRRYDYDNLQNNTLLDSVKKDLTVILFSDKTTLPQNQLSVHKNKKNLSLWMLLGKRMLHRARKTVLKSRDEPISKTQISFINHFKTWDFLLCAGKAHSLLSMRSDDSWTLLYTG